MRVCTLSLSDLCQDIHTTLRHGSQNKTGYRRYLGLFSTKEHILSHACVFESYLKCWFSYFDTFFNLEVFETSSKMCL